MDPKERLDQLRNEVSDGFDKYNRENEYDDPSWRRTIQNGLLMLRSDIKEGERKSKENEDTISLIVRWYLKNAPKKQLAEIYALCVPKKECSLETFVSECRENQIPDPTVETIVLAVPLLIDTLKGETQ